ncbi:MAG: ATP-binding protein [Betaproteobacteria bacterium]
MGVRLRFRRRRPETLRITPNTLSARIALLIVLVMIGSQIVTVTLFRQYRTGLVSQRVAEIIASHARSMTLALEILESAQRNALIEKSRSDSGAQLFPARQFSPPAREPGPPFTRRIADRLKPVLGPDMQVLFQDGDRPTLWVQFRAAGELYWAGFPASRFEMETPWTLIAVVFGLVGVAVGGAFLVVWRINRPLRQLSSSASALGKGEMPAPVEITGPEEVRSLSRNFNRMAEDLKELEADRALLLAGVSHDLRTPLARLRLGTEMMTDASLRNGMIQDIQDMDRIIGQFISFVRDSGNEPDELVDLNEMVDGTCTRYRRLGHTIAVDLQPLPPLRIKPTAMQRLLGNLLDNALRHGAEPIEVRTLAKEGVITLSVIDHGPGIPATELERMKQPFTRLDAARGGKGTTGLGLAIVERIARLHGGKFILANRPEGGLDATVEWPMQPDPST